MEWIAVDDRVQLHEPLTELVDGPQAGARTALREKLIIVEFTPYDETGMRTVKLLAAALAAFIGGWLLILTRGVLVALQAAHPEWYPCRPIQLRALLRT